MSKTNQTLRDVLRAYGDVLLDLAEQASFKPESVKREAVEKTVNANENQALKEISELLLECKPENKILPLVNGECPENAQDFMHYMGYNQAIDDYEKNIKDLL